MKKHKLKSRPTGKSNVVGQKHKSVKEKGPSWGPRPQKYAFKVKKQQANKQSKVDYSSMSVDEFLSNGFKYSDESSNEQNETYNSKSKHLKNGNTEIVEKTKNRPQKRARKESNGNAEILEKIETQKQNQKETEDEADTGELKFDDDISDEDALEDNTNIYENEIESHKASLEKLKKTDPEFYKFLQENDKKLLEFNVSDSEEESDEEEKIHKPTDELEVASDESDFEAEDESQGDQQVQKVTLKLLKSWQVALQSDKTNKTIGSVVQAFHAALLRVANEDNESSQYKVEGSSIFNAVIQLCVLELSPAIRRFLGLKSGSKVAPHKCKKFTKIKSFLKIYFTDLLKLLGGVTSANILTVLLKHLHHMSPLFVSFPNISKPMIKKLIHLWGTSDEVVRVLAFLCIVRITNNQTINLLDTVLKSMYMTFVVNSKFVSVNSLSSINFMRRSLVEIFALDPATAYQHVFLYIRQLAIHLRNAITVHKKENIQSVYNWQFVNSLKLWGNLLAATYNKKELQPLVYPFVQVCLGTIKLVPTAQYYPLRFHVVQILIEFSKETGVFIPVLPFILDVLTAYDFNKKHKRVSMKPLRFTAILRVSNSQFEENGFKDTLIESVYGCLLEYLASQSHSIAFPDLSLFSVMQLKSFLNKCKVANYNKKMKQILDKISQNNEFIERERKNVTFTLTDTNKITAWETGIKNKGTPMNTFFQNWNAMRTIKKNKEATNSESLGEYNLPTIKRIKRNSTTESNTKSANPFPSDSEDSDSNINIDVNPKSNKKRKKRKNQKKIIENKEEIYNNNDDIGETADIVEDINITDW